MFTISRRAFIQGLASVPLALWGSRYANAQTELLIRHDADSPHGLEMLKILAGAVAAMQSRGPHDPLSWLWQWYTHFVDGTTTKGDEMTRIFGATPTTGSALANEMWNTCQSHAGQDPNHFLPWHRMYVFFFENIVREVSGRPDFTLPYWNYTSFDPAQRGVVPLAFRLPDDPVFAPLYRPDRTELANSGQPIHLNQTRDVMDISTPMSKAEYSTVGRVQGFCRSLDSSIHGRIHVLVGTRDNMGRVPYAARDPLFWVHHSNIDRLWASWNRDGGRNPREPWSDTRFVFADAQGERVSRALKSFFSTRSLGYNYDEFFPRMRSTSTSTSTSSTSTSTSTMAAQSTRTGSVFEQVARGRSAELGEDAVQVALRPVANTKRTEVLGLDQTQSEKRTYLVLKDLHTWAQPEVLYYVYLTPARGAARNQASYVGDINFFDAEFHDHGNGALGDALGENFYSFDVTDILLKIAASHQRNARDELRVTFVPGGRPTPGAKPLVSTIELVRQ